MKADELNFLVVEDDDFQRQMIVNMLRGLGATSISSANNGKSALELIQWQDARSIDIALCDLNMPEMDGMAFLRHLSQEQHNIAIIIISAVDSKLLESVGRMAALYDIQLLGMAEKPILPEQLNALLSLYTRSERTGREPAEPEMFTLEEILCGIQSRQFEPFFQPKIDLNTGRVMGAEALARWIHPERGLIPPSAFIKQLEQSGNIDDLTFAILEKAAAACRSFHERGSTLSVSINLSLISLDNSALAEKITKTVRKSGVDPQYIVLEITESTAMTDIGHALENLARLCMNGFSLSVDDYGTGYSSLQQLTRIAFSELKIDQSLVKGFTDNEALRIVVESSIDMARKLGVKSVAEGVETQQEWDMLKTIGCDIAQGYLIARPMDADAFFDFMSEAKAA